MNGYYCGHGEIIAKFESMLAENAALRAALGQAGKALTDLINLRSATDMVYESAYRMLFKSDGRDAWEQAQQALADPLVIEAMKDYPGP